jgi:choloylglycine hydrolase
MNYTKKISLGALLCLAMFSNVDACTRVIYEGADERFITARSMDWKEDIPSALWIFPKGMKKDGGIDKNSIQWTSKYGSLAMSGYNAAIDDGMNEKGLVANLLYLVESDYGSSKNPTISIGALTQYVLDNYATVSEAVKGLQSKPLQVVAPSLPGGEKAALHLALSDASGDSAVFEFIKGKLVVHHSKEYKTMTNSPTYDEQLAINNYFKKMDGMVVLPGTNKASDRFARASFYTNSIPKAKSQKEAVATAFSIIRNASVPIGITSPGEPNIASTLWRSVSDQKALTYYFDSATAPSVFWIDLKKLDLKQNASVKKLDLKNYPDYSGEVSSEFTNATPFKWMK